MKRKPDETWNYEGQDFIVRNINWTQHLDHAWRCSWQDPDKSWKSHVEYGRTAEEAFNNMANFLAINSNK